MPPKGLHIIYLITSEKANQMAGFMGLNSKGLRDDLLPPRPGWVRSGNGVVNLPGLLQSQLRGLKLS